MSESSDGFECSACRTLFREEDELDVHEESCPERLAAATEEAAEQEYNRLKAMRTMEYEEEDMLHDLSEEEAELLYQAAISRRTMEIDHEVRKARADAKVLRTQSQLKDVSRS